MILLVHGPIMTTNSGNIEYPTSLQDDGQFLRLGHTAGSHPSLHFKC